MEDKRLQIENGNFTQIVNPLIEQLIQIPFKGCELATSLFIIRKTYGFHKSQDSISLSQFEKGLKRSRPTIVKALKNLQLVNIVKLVKVGNVKRQSNIWRINKYYMTWELVKVASLVKTKHSTSKDGFTKTSKDGFTHKIKKETNTKERGLELEEQIKQQIMEYSYDDDVREIRKRGKITKEENSFLISIGCLWVDMVSKHLGLNKEEVPIKNIYYAIRACYDREKFTKEDYKNLFTYFLGSSLKNEDKISFDLCLSEKYVAKYKISKKYRKETFASISNEIKL